MADIFETQDGSHSIYSAEFGVSYHSKYGAIQETQHVFIEAALRHKSLVNKELHILEIGFGSGLNAFMTYLETEKFNLKIHYTTFEKFPISFADSQKLNFVETLTVPESAVIFQKMHESNWNERHALGDNFTFEKHNEDFSLIDYKNEFDVIYFDAFAPTSQPELWEAPMMQKMFDALKSGGVLTTYCAKGVVKRTLKSVGFEIESLQGPPGKREMTRGKKG